MSWSKFSVVLCLLCLFVSGRTPIGNAFDIGQAATHSMKEARNYKHFTLGNVGNPLSLILMMLFEAHLDNLFTLYQV